MSYELGNPLVRCFLYESHPHPSRLRRATFPLEGGRLRLSKKSFRPKDSEGGIVGKGTVRVPFP